MIDFLLGGRRRNHLLAGVYLSGLTLATATVALVGTDSFHFPVDPFTSLLMIGLFPGSVFVIASRRESNWVSVLLFPLAVLATVASGVYHHLNYPGPLVECALYRVNIGFPVPWNSVYELHANTNSSCPVPALPLLVQAGPNMVSFYIDITFYFAVGLAITQLFRGISGKIFTVNQSGARLHSTPV